MILKDYNESDWYFLSLILPLSWVYNRTKLFNNVTKKTKKSKIMKTFFALLFLTQAKASDSVEGDWKQCGYNLSQDKKDECMVSYF